ncbi:MAG: TPM domain-containing protein [Deltaproteobacteria bacterium]|nr:TPM domain-containing protein [Deltaproteobacteria bacterium]
MLLLHAASLSAAETPIPAAPTRWATDTAGFLTEATRADLDARLRAYEARSGHQVVLWIGRTTGDAPIEDWAVRAFAAWRVGRTGLDDGAVLFVMADDRKVRLEVGYGLEGQLPDARAATIIREQIVPRLRGGDRDGAARAGVDGILRALGDTQTGQNLVGAESEHQRRPALGLFQLIVVGLLGLIFVGFLVTHPGLAILLLTTLASGRSRGGGGGFGGGGFGGGGGGGFGGGGGRSGGGGATGSW